jgi:transposase
VLDKIQDGKITRNEASVALGITNRQVNHLMQTWRVQRPIANYFFEHVAAQIKWEIRKKYAIEFVAGTCTVEEAAENAQVSARQMRRWVSELLQKHFGMVWKDLRTLSDSKRRRLADEIETAEGLELAKQNVIRSITVGETTLNDVAAEIATHKRKKPHVRRIKTPKPKL